MNIDERLEALTMNLELASRDIHDLQTAIQQDAENIRALAVVAKAQSESIKSLENIVVGHDQRLDNLEEKH